MLFKILGEGRVGAPLVKIENVLATNDGTGLGVFNKPSTSNKRSPGKYPAQNEGN